MNECQYYVQDGEYDLDTIKDEYHREVEVEQDGESYLVDKWECPVCGELYDSPDEAFDCCRSWAERDPEGYKDYMRGNE